MSNWHERFIQHRMESLDRDTEIPPINELKGNHGLLMITDFPISKYHRIDLDRR